MNLINLDRTLGELTNLRP